MILEEFSPKKIDERRAIHVPGDKEQTLKFCAEHFIACMEKSISDHGAFYIALSGGSTPKALFTLLSAPPYNERIVWEKLHLFWGDERNVPPTDPDSNYKMAMDAGFAKMAIPEKQIHRMVCENDLEENAKAYEETIRKTLGKGHFDYIMLGMGDDGHTASLFPHTHALNEMERLVVPNYIPQKKCWRMTLTYRVINRAHHIVFYVMGDGKKERLKQVLLGPENFPLFPSQKVGAKHHVALWICDTEAAALVTH